MHMPAKNKAKKPAKRVSSKAADNERRPGVAAILRRARIPYESNPLSEDEALNLICEARQGEPTYPIQRLIARLAHGMGD